LQFNIAASGGSDGANVRRNSISYEAYHLHIASKELVIKHDGRTLVEAWYEVEVIGNIYETSLLNK